jgi:hypothetical protein
VQLCFQRRLTLQGGGESTNTSSSIHRNDQGDAALQALNPGLCMQWSLDLGVVHRPIAAALAEAARVYQQAHAQLTEPSR